MKLSKLSLIATALFLINNIQFKSLEAYAQTTPDKWDLTWSDEFDGSEINSSNWTYDIDGHGWGNNELEYYTNRPENARIEDGNLVIEARKESYNGSQYTSARLKSEGLQNFLYGKVEARMKLPEGQGFWPAFWMLGSNMASVKWPDCGEIDIMEHINDAKNVLGTLHWNAHNGNMYESHGGQTNIDVSQYHNYSIEWSPNYIKWFVDDNEYFEYDITNNVNGTESLHKPFFIVLNLAVGGNLPQNPDASTNFPAKMYVDYVRVYNRHSDSISISKPRNAWYKDKSNGYNYYLDGDGNPYKGWLYLKDYWYYLDSDGKMKTGWLNDSGNWYYLNEQGIMLKNTTIDGYTLDSNGVWIY
ncbi:MULTISPECIES: glycoside hydrolase family 16 protein [unclassified Clostridium]|uniref:glycoside hydrolase family 16 protein n=1 Tax=unclassified Clostridium TaxID=2614128 RepID=UPI00029755E8|nr:MULTISPECIES: glycoside hydrolase family 16 protein [unclassified Clostridium]EKQ53163.1 MAG: beta-glucanase/beta-glucan synthetase [Clostridium sp. Maddingley MBC34-26]